MVKQLESLFQKDSFVFESRNWSLSWDTGGIYHLFQISTLPQIKEYLDIRQVHFEITFLSSGVTNVFFAKICKHSIFVADILNYDQNADLLGFCGFVENLANSGITLVVF